MIAAGDDKVRVYLLGNPVIWWANIAFLLVFLLIYSYSSLKSQRGVAESPELAKQREVTLVAAAWFFLGWALHYVPFWAMGRVLYIHHYYPALLFSSMLSAVLLDYITLAPSSLASVLVHTCLATFATCCYTFYIFSDLAILINQSYSKTNSYFLLNK